MNLGLISEVAGKCFSRFCQAELTNTAAAAGKIRPCRFFLSGSQRTELHGLKACK